MTTIPPRAVFFDLDGTLLDSERLIDACWHAAIEALCGSAGVDPHELHNACASERREFWEDPARATNARFDYDRADRMIARAAVAHVRPDLPALSDQIADDYRRRRENTTTLFPGVIRVLETLRYRAIRTALITNGSERTQREKIGRFGLRSWFDVILIAGELGVGKPDERVFRRALESCDVAPAEAWMVGNDLDADIATPHRLGLYTVWVHGESATAPHEGSVTPHRAIREIGELEVW